MKRLKPEELKKQMDSGTSNLVIVDVRYALSDTDKGKQLYAESHIPGAIYLHMSQDLSGEAEKHGGRHPIPNTEEISKRLGEVGIDQNTMVVAYDDKKGSFASRLSWQLHYLGHEQFSILEGGYEAWVEAGYPTTTNIPTYPEKTFVPSVRKEERVTREDVIQRLGSSDSILIDARAPERYAGGADSLDAKSGHIPGALNYFWEDLLDDSGNWKSGAALADHFKALPKDKEIIVYCGSGVTACPNVFGLKEAGFHHVKLYSGSWSDWVSYEDSPIETGTQK